MRSERSLWMRLGWMLALLATPTALLAIGFAASASTAGGAELSMSPREYLASTYYAYGFEPNLRSKLEKTDSVALIRVKAVSEPYWNSNDGLYWDGSEGSPHQVYSTVDAAVEEVIAGQSAPDMIQLIIIGDGSVRHEGEDPPPFAALSGGFVVGELHLVTLVQTHLPFEDGLHPVWTLANDFQANWRIVGEDAIGSLTSDSASRDALIGAIIAAWPAAASG